MDLKDIHERLDFFCDKQSIYFSPEEKDARLHDAQIQRFAELAPAYAVNQQVRDALRPFKREYVFTNSSSAGGTVTLPEDYLHLLAVETMIMNGNVAESVKVEIPGEDKISYRKSSALIPNNALNPFGEMMEERKLQLYPKQPAAGTVRYLRQPVAPKFAYTVANGRPVYDAATSVQMEWDDVNIQKIIFLALQGLGINIKDAEVVNYGTAKQQ